MSHNTSCCSYLPNGFSLLRDSINCATLNLSQYHHLLRQKLILISSAQFKSLTLKLIKQLWRDWNVVWYDRKSCSKAANYFYVLVMGTQFREQFSLLQMTSCLIFLFSQNAHNLSMPKWATKDVLDKLKELYMFGFKWLFNTPQKSRLTGGIVVPLFVQKTLRFTGDRGLKLNN